MTVWLTMGLVALAVVAGVLFQANGKLDQTNSAQLQTVADQKQQLSDQASAVAETASLKNQLASARSDADRAHATAASLQNQSNNLSSQLASRDQTIREDQSQAQQLNAQVQQLTTADNAATAELSDLKSRYAIATGRLEITGAPTLTPTQGTAVIVYPTRNIVEAKSIEANALAAQRAASNRVVAISSGMRSQLEAMPDFMQAKSDLDASQSAYDSARESVLITLHSSTDYIAATEAKKLAEKSINDARETGTSSEELSGLAQKSLDAGVVVTNLEASALAANADFQDAKAKRDIARSNMRQLDQQFQTMLSASQAYQQAKIDFDAAVANHNAALANVQALDQIEGSRIAADESRQTEADFNAIHQNNIQLQQPQQSQLRDH